MNQLSNPITITFDLSRSSKNSQNLKTGNEMINANDRLHFHVKNEITQHLRYLAKLQGRNTINKLMKDKHIFTQTKPCFIIVHIAPPSNRRMDAPNWYPTTKALIDGLTDIGMFEDDNDTIITSFTFLRDKKTTNKKYRITLEIYDGTLFDSIRRLQGDV